MFYLRTLDDTAWSIADVTGPIGTGTHIFDINFTANDQEFTSIRFVDGTDSGQVYFDATLVNEYPRDGWVDTAYQNVKIAGGVDATNPSLLSWFRQNAKNLTPSNDDASITKALQDIAEAISSGGGGDELPSTEEASAGDVLSLDEAKQPTWAPASGGGLPEYSGENSAFLGYYRDDNYNLVMGWRENVGLFVNDSNRLYKDSAKTQPVTDVEMSNWITSGITVTVNKIPSYNGVRIIGYQGGVAIAFKSWTGDTPEFYKYTTY